MATRSKKSTSRAPSVVTVAGALLILVLAIRVMSSILKIFSKPYAGRWSITHPTAHAAQSKWAKWLPDMPSPLLRRIQVEDGFYYGPWYLTSIAILHTNVIGTISPFIIREILNNADFSKVDFAFFQERLPEQNEPGVRAIEVLLFFPGMVFHGKN